ncbi:EamA family transporter [Roseateles sp. DAIF2]|uniref:EamA family transporter n=1 Tax=Roseateles sp. DAIF2 TaxID=2714952 RepID=UPI0018A32FF8|nr:EamA family transporter [Roseateles sp. DAIF2]QPF74629.1 EamA family transporter [Roseateles sp. DAIF2]
MGDTTLPVLLAVLLGALLHAGWNALIKSAPDKALNTALIHGMGTLLAVPLLLFNGPPAAAAWPYLIASTLIHIGYYTALAGAYKHGDLGLTYPLMRGSAPLLVALGSAPLLGERLSPLAWAGVVTICAGVLALGLSSAASGDERRRRKAIRYALLNAVFIAAYTVVDGLGVRANGGAGSYVAALFLLDGLPYLALVLWQRRARLAEVRAYVAERWPMAAGGTAASLGSYGIALWAMMHAPVATVAALRETSVLFAALLGTWLLRERFGWQRAAGTLIIVAGIMALRMG